MNKKLIEEARSLAKGKDPRTAWLDLRAWMHSRGSSAERVAVFTFLREHSANPSAVHLFPEVLREAAKVATSLPADERKTLVELADCASKTIKGDISLLNPKEDNIIQLPLADNRPAPVLSFKPSKDLRKPSFGAISPLAPSADINHYIRMRDELPKINDRLHEMPAPRLKEREGLLIQDMQYPEELISFSRPAEPLAVQATRGEELVRALKEKMKRQGIEEKESREPRAAKPSKRRGRPKKKRRGRPLKKEVKRRKATRTKKANKTGKKKSKRAAVKKKSRK